MLTASRNHSSANDNVGKHKPLLKGRSRIEHFLNIVMMVSDRLRYGIEIISEFFGHLSQLDSTSTSTASSSIVSARLISPFLFIDEDISIIYTNCLSSSIEL